MNWLARVYVVPKEEVLDPQGEAILGALRHLGVGGVDAVRSGRLFELHIANCDRDAAERLADDAARRLLCNIVVETYQVAVDPSIDPSPLASLPRMGDGPRGQQGQQGEGEGARV